MPDNISKIGIMFGQRRRELGLSQESLGERIGVGRSRISKIESGKGLTFETIKKVASALDTEVKVDLIPYHKPDRDKLYYTMVVIGKFAHRHGLSRKAAVKYLVKYKGIDFLDDFYDVEHTLSFNDCIDDLTSVCQNNGGGLTSNQGVAILEEDMTDEKTFNLLIEFLTADLTRFLMQENEGMTMSEAVLLLHDSEWFNKVSNPESQLYSQSAAYNYELLKHELKYGTLE